MSPLEHPKEKYSSDTPAKLTRAKLNKRSGDADLSKDKLAQRYLRAIRQREWRIKVRGNQADPDIRPYLDKEYPLNEEVKQVDEIKYGEFGLLAPFNGSSGDKFRVDLLGYYTRTDN
ncbi:hypothetical protein Tco_0859589 [Tanacetum coccineum]|uniref:Uncharacterized protein n=1 Tax=Tanacetum coccineum TaxID=301880 RepID=A0ABQ5BFI8_9ASTR